MKRMLFNATQQEELRVAIVDGQKLLDLDIEASGKEQYKSNIYKAVITRIEPSLEACFVNYGEDRHGFLPFKEVVRSLFKEGIDVRSASIRDALQDNQEIMVQVEKEERGSKGAALTTFISLAGRYLVLMPNNPRGGGVSRRVEGEERQELRDNIDRLDLPPGMSVIARTAGIGRSVEELQWDLNYLLQLWRAIESAGKSAPGAFLIYHESSLVIRAIRDYFQPDIGEILIDTDEIYEQARQFMSYVMPEMVHRVKRYSDDIPLFSRFQIEHQIETAYSRIVPLPSGGSIVIDHTEALVSIDVNSARATRGSNIETTAFNTNCEAVDEVARQLRLRDLGGLIVIDFIDMEVAKNKREIENRLKEALRHDRARVQMDKISRFGLIELSRQRLRPSLSEGSHRSCPRCNGTGHIRDVESFALQVLRIIEEESMKESSATVNIQLPVDVAAFLLNEKRGEIMKIEARHRVSVVVVPNTYLETPRYKLERIKLDDPRLDDPNVSYELAEKVEPESGASKTNKENAKQRQEALVKSISPDVPPPARVTVPTPAQPEAASGGFWERVLSFFGIEKVPDGQDAPVTKPAAKVRHSRNADRTRNRNRARRGRERNRDEQLDEAVALTPVTADEEMIPVADQDSLGKEDKKRSIKVELKSAKKKKKDKIKVRTKDKPLVEDESIFDTEETTVIEVDVILVTEDEEENTETEAVEIEETEEVDVNEDDTRRRRRRGGRNRHRRDRESIVDSMEVAEIKSVAVQEIDEIVDGILTDTRSWEDLGIRDTARIPSTHPVASEEAAAEISPKTLTDVEKVKALETSAPEAELGISDFATSPVFEPEPEMEAVEVETVELPSPEVAAPEAEPVIYNRRRAFAPEEEVIATVETVPPAETAGTDDMRVTEEATVADETITFGVIFTSDESADSETEADSEDSAEETAFTENIAEEDTPADSGIIVPDRPVHESQTIVQVQLDEESVSMPATQESPPDDLHTSGEQLEDITQVLAQAGLTMASTDPAKLRIAEETAAALEANDAPVHHPRRRRAPPPVMDEPLIQVNTQKSGSGQENEDQTFHERRSS